MALTDGIKNKLTAIADAIRSKTNKTEKLTPEQMASAIEELKVGKLNFEGVFNQEQANYFNSLYQVRIAYAKQIADAWDETNATCVFKDTNIVFFPIIKTPNVKQFKFNGCTNLEYMPEDFDISSATDTFQCWHECTKLKRLPNILDCRNSTFLNRLINNLPSLEKFPQIKNTNNVKTFEFCFSNIRLNVDIAINTDSAVTFYGTFYASQYKSIILTSLRNATSFTNTYTNTNSLVTLKFTEWKKGDISLAQSSLLSAESINYIIQNALENVNADGTPTRTLTLHATAKTNWQNSEYYEQDLAVLPTKGITIA